MKTTHRPTIFATARKLVSILFFSTVIGQAANVSALSLTLDTWGQNDPSYPYLMVLEMNNTIETYAGVFSGFDNASLQRYFVFCADLFTPISIGDTYDVTLYQNVLNAPLTNALSPISEEQKKVIRGEFVYLGLTPCSVRGLVPVNSAVQNMVGTIKDGLLSLTPAEAAAAQLVLWEIIHEPWTGRTGLDLDSGNLAWAQTDFSPLPQSVYDAFAAIADGAFANMDVTCPVPEPSGILLLGLGCGVLALWRRKGGKGQSF